MAKIVGDDNNNNHKTGSKLVEFNDACLSSQQNKSASFVSLRGELMQIVLVEFYGFMTDFMTCFWL